MFEKRAEKAKAKHILANTKIKAVVLVCMMLSLLLINPASISDSSDDEDIYFFEFDSDDIIYATLQNETGVNFSAVYLNPLLSYSAMEGSPALPKKPLNLVIPNGKILKDVSVSILSQETSPVSYPIYPQQKEYPTSFTGVREWQYNDALYESSEKVLGNSFDENNWSVGYCCGIPILSLVLYPVDYSPGNNLIYVFTSISVTLTYDVGKSTNEFYRPGNSKDINQVSETVDNPDALLSYEEVHTGDATTYDGGLCDSEDDYDYVIITNISINDTTGYTYNWSDLLTHRANPLYGGLTGCKVTCEEINACQDYWNETALFNDSQAHIREFCKDAYEDWGTEYILIGGTWQIYGSGASESTKVVPFRLFTDRYEYDTYDTMMCDFYYSHLDGDWYYTGSGGMWGGGALSGVNDKFGELYLGRLLVSDAEEVSNIIEKIIWYDTNEHSTDWLKNISFSGGDLGWAVESKQYMEELREGDGAYGENTGFEEWNDNNPGYEFDTSRRYYHADYGDAWKTPFKNELSNNTIAVVNHLGHGSPSVIFNLKDIYWLHNSNFLFGHSGGCNNGRFEYNTQIEDWMVEYDDRGAYAFIANTGYGYESYSSTYGAGQQLRKTFWNYFFDNQSTNTSNWQFGKAQAHSKDVYSSLISSHTRCYQWYSSHLFGDPAQVFNIGSRPGNIPPILSNMDPGDGATEIPINQSHWNITIFDLEGDEINWTIEVNNSNSNSGNGDTNGTKSCALSNLVYNAVYTVWVNATDWNGSGNWTNATYTFETMIEPPPNNPPVFYNEVPESSSPDISRWPSCNVTICDLDGDELIVYFYEYRDGEWTLLQTNNSHTANESAMLLNFTNASEYSTTYYWSVNVSDGIGGNWVNETYHFTTLASDATQQSSESPANRSSSVSYDSSEISVYIEDPNGAKINWTIETSPDIGSSSGDNESNGSKTCNVALVIGTNYTWFVNSSNGEDWTNETYWFIVNTFPTIGTPYPANGTSDVSTNLTLNITIADINDDTMNLTWLSNSSGEWLPFATGGLSSGYEYSYGFEDEAEMDNWTTNGLWSSSEAYSYSGSHSITIDGWEYAYHNLSLANQTSINISWWNYPDNLMPAKYLYLRFFDGTDWATIREIHLYDVKNQFTHYYDEIDSTEYNFSDNCRICWNASSGFDDCYLDEINITYTYQANLKDGTYSQTNANFSEYETTYWWNVSVYDGTNTNYSDMFHFTTLDVDAPVISNEAPTDGSSSISLTPTLSAYINYSGFRSHADWDRYCYNSTLQGHQPDCNPSPISNDLLWSAWFGSGNDNYAGAIVHDGLAVSYTHLTLPTN